MPEEDEYRRPRNRPRPGQAQPQAQRAPQQPAQQGKPTRPPQQPAQQGKPTRPPQQPAQQGKPPGPQAKPGPRRGALTSHPLIHKIDQADLDKELPDPKELESVEVDEIDFIGMFYEGAKLSDVVLNNVVHGCRRILNHALGRQSDNFNEKFEMAKHIVRGTGVFAKAAHGYPPMRRKANMAMTNFANKRWGGVSKEAIAEFQHLYAIWTKEFVDPYISGYTPKQLQMGFSNRKFVDKFHEDSTSWMVEKYNAEDQKGAITSLCIKFLRQYSKEVSVAKTKFYEAFEPTVVPRPPPTLADKEREKIAKDTSLMGLYDVDLLVRPNKKKKKRRR